MCEGGDVVRIVGKQPLMKRLLLAQSFHAFRAQPGIEFSLLNTEPRSKAHQSGAEESTGQSETGQKKQAAQGEPEEIREFAGLIHLTAAPESFEWKHMRSGNLLKF